LTVTIGRSILVSPAPHIQLQSLLALCCRALRLALLILLIFEYPVRWQSHTMPRAGE